ncbi:MAG: S8 family serine peptidase [Bacteroidales bacterium]|nr:S8 family serine peptidase [Bacteroidales bacterium]
MENFTKEYRVTEWIEDGSNGILEAQVNIPNGNYDDVLKSLKEKEYIIDIEPVIGDSVLTNTSRLFYIMLHDAQDYSMLSSNAQRFGVEIRGEVDFCNNWYELRVNKNSAGNSIEVANKFWETGCFASIDPGFILRFKPALVTTCVTDPRFNEQWGMQAIKACSAWKITKGDTNVRIAVIDMGVDTSHREFDSTHVVFSYDIDTCSSPANVYYEEILEEGLGREDPHGSNAFTHIYHGIHVGGIIFANHNRDSVAGVCPNAGLIDISCSFKLGGDTAISRIAQSIKRADSLRAKVINNSWECEKTQNNQTFTSLLETSIDTALAHDCVVVFAAGNNTDSFVCYPARYNPELLVVGAVDSYFSRQYCSNFGFRLDIVAPGEEILSTHNNNGYYSGSGTSVATPHVSGVAGLMFSINPVLTGREVRDIIEQTVRKDLYESYTFDTIHENGSWDHQVGYGLLDAHRAVLKAAYHKVYGDTALILCDTNRHVYTVRAPHNANIDSVSFFWTCSGNLQMVAGQNTDSVWVKRINSGAGQLSCHIIHDGDTVTTTLDIPIFPGRTVYDNITLNSGITYPDTFVLSREVVVDSLSMLTWQDKTVLCTPDCRLIVRPGGKLVVDGGTLTSACPNEMWQGIEVVGDRTKQQLAQYQGKVELKNGAVIENALCGIRTGLREDTEYITTGGIISAEDATFVNNCRAIEINSYAGVAPAGTVADNACGFENCTFTVGMDNHFAANNTAFTEHVRLWDVKGVKFKGCTFENQSNNMFGNGRGIYAEDAGLRLDVKCANNNVGMPGYCGCPPSYADSCLFNGFSTAVEINATGTPYTLTVNRVRFENNGTGVQINGNEFVTLTLNDFNLQRAPYTVSNCGVKLNGCTGYKVEGNRFHKAGKNILLSSRGVSVNNSGPSANSIYRNIFDTLDYGIEVLGANGGLQLSCDSFNYCDYDIYAYNGSIATSQGSVQQGADNQFVNTQVSSLYFSTGKNRIYHYSNIGFHTPYLPYNVSIDNTAEECGCASTLCDNGGGPYVPLTSFASQVSAYTAALSGTDDDGLEGANDYSSLQALRQTLSDTYYAAVREIMSDTVLDLNELEQWHTAAHSANLANYANIGDPYSLTETRFMLGNSEPFTADAEDAEMANYAEFHALKLALRDNIGGTDSANGASQQDGQNSSLETGGGAPVALPLRINWYALTDGQIAQLQTIAERNTGRASVMARGVLCFFHGICYEDEWDDEGVFDTSLQDGDTAGTRAHRTAMDTDNDATLSVYPNPTDDVLFVELSGGAGIANVALYDLQGRVVETRRAASLQKTTASMDMKSVPAGVYVLRVTAVDGKEYHRKIVKK